MVIKDGRFGPYVTDGETNASLRKGDSVEEITDERAVGAAGRAAGEGPGAEEGPGREAGRRKPADEGAGAQEGADAEVARRGQATPSARVAPMCALRCGRRRLLRRRQQRLDRRRHPLAVRPPRRGRLRLLHHLAHLPRARRLPRLGLHRRHRVPGQRRQLVVAELLRQVARQDLALRALLRRQLVAARRGERLGRLRAASWPPW